MLDTEHNYKIVEVIGTSESSWEDAAKNVIAEVGRHLRDLRVAEVMEQDAKIEKGKIVAYRTKLRLSFKYHHEE